MEISDFMGIMVVGAVLSLVIQGLKNWLGTDSLSTRGLTIALALIVGGGYVWLRSTPYFQTAVLVLTTASAVYAIFITPIEKMMSKTLNSER